MSKRQERKLYKNFAKIIKQLSKEISSNPSQAANIIKTFISSKEFKTWASKLSNDFVKISNSANKKLKYWKHTNKAGSRKLGFNLTEEDILMLAQQNFTMIKSVPESLLKKLSTKMGKKLYNQALGDVGKRDDLYKFLQSKGVKNAKLIARTETAKINTQITQVRSAKVGSIAYKWGTSNDVRVRQSHKNMNGVVVFWDDKPQLDNMVGHAGEYPNCRCQTIPIIYIEQFLFGKL